MRAVVVYESMFGNTHAVSLAIGEGLRSRFDHVTVVPASGATGDVLADADLLVVGGPTHAHGMSSAPSRRSAADMAAARDGLVLDPDARGEGLRDWFDHVPEPAGLAAAAFDTRVDGPAVVTGRASKGIARRLRRHGYQLVAEPESFLVDKENHLLADEADRATEWGEMIAAELDDVTVVDA